MSEEARGAVLGAALEAEHADRSAASSALVILLHVPKNVDAACVRVLARTCAFVCV